MELYHHGVKGQEWGVRNGPPYPLDRKKEFEKAKKHYNKIFSSPYSYSKKSKAIQQVANAEDLRGQVDELIKANDEIDAIEQKYSKELAKIARPEVLKVAKKHGWDDEDIEDIKNNDDRVFLEISEDVFANGDWTGAFTQLAKTNKEYNNALRKYKTAHANALKAAKKYTENIVGEYGDEELDKYYKYKYRDFVNDAIETASGINSHWFPSHHPALKVIK